MPKETDLCNTKGRSKYSLQNTGKFTHKIQPKKMIDVTKTCLTCGKNISHVLLIAELDPYCSAECCRKNHGMHKISKTTS